MIEHLSLLSFASGGWGQALLAGALVTLALALACLPVGLPLGLGLALAARSKKPWLRSFATLFSTVFRGLPELLTLLIIYYGCQIGAQKILAAMGYETQVTINTFLAAMVAFSFVFAAFSSEIWLGAFKTVHKGQYEASAALGLSKATTFRKVVFPQLVRIALPGLSNNWLSLLKDTSLVSAIGLAEMAYAARTVAGAYGRYWEPYLAVALAYWLMTFLLTVGLRKLEDHLARSDRT